MASEAVPDSTPKSTLPYPPLHTEARFVVLTDWDGTVTTFDSNDHLTDNYGFGHEKRRALNLECLAGRMTFRDSFREMLKSIKPTFEECKEILKRDIKLDPGFSEFYAWCKVNRVPVVIVSSGMEPLIRASLSQLIGEDEASKIDVICNGVKFTNDGRWEIEYRHPESGYGHDKSEAILPYRKLPQPPTLFFFGDGVSDMSAAKHADVLFVKVGENGESDLASYCATLGIKNVKFTDFGQTLPIVQAVVQGTMSVGEALAVGDVRVKSESVGVSVETASGESVGESVERGKDVGAGAGAVTETVTETGA